MDKPKAGRALVLVLLVGLSSCTFQKVRLAPDWVRVEESAPRPAWPGSYRLVHRFRAQDQIPDRGA